MAGLWPLTVSKDSKRRKQRFPGHTQASSQASPPESVRDTLNPCNRGHSRTPQHPWEGGLPGLCSGLGDPGESVAALGQGSTGSAWSLTASLPGSVTSLRLLSHLGVADANQTCLTGRGKVRENVELRDLPAVQWLRLLLPLQGSWVQSLIRERRSYKPFWCRQKKKKHGTQGSAWCMERKFSIFVSLLSFSG